MATNSHENTLCQLIKVIKQNYSQVPVGEVSQKVKTQIIPMLITAFFQKPLSGLHQNSTKSIKRTLQVFKQNLHSPNRKPLTQLKNTIKNQNNGNEKEKEKLTKTVVFYLKIIKIMQKRKHQWFSILKNSNNEKKKSIVWLIRKWKQCSVEKVIQKFILNARVTIFQHEAIYTFHNLYQRKKRQAFIRIKKYPNQQKNIKLINFGLKIVERILRQKVKFALRKITDQCLVQNKWLKESIAKIAYKGCLTHQTVFWRLMKYSIQMEKCEKMCKILMQITLKMNWNKIKRRKDLSKKTCSLVDLSNKLGDLSNKNDILACSTRNLLQVKFFKMKIDGFQKIWLNNSKKKQKQLMEK